jgi:hypothetical protein
MHGHLIPLQEKKAKPDPLNQDFLIGILLNLIAFYKEVFNQYAYPRLRITHLITLMFLGILTGFERILDE